jgi:hypothetical protein
VVRAPLGLLVVAACAGKQAPPPASKPAPVQAADCTDVGVVMRGEIESDDPAAGPAKEQVFASSCRREQWSQSIIDCIASTLRPTSCLDKLDEAQRVAFEDRLQRWHDDYHEPDDDPDDAGPALTCDDVLGDVAVFDPPIAADAPERAWHVAQRKAWLHEECDHGWSEVARACIVIALRVDDRAAANRCLTSQLDADEQDEMKKQLAEYARLAGKIAAAKQKPRAITCKHVVATHYGAAAWKQKLDGFSAAARKKMIAASRDRMTKACTAESWDDTLRACLVARGGETCFATHGMRLRWGYPAAGTVTSTGIAECDAYAAAVARITACPEIPETSRDTLASAQQQMLAQIAGAPADRRAQMASSCTAGVESIESVIKASGC